MDTKVFVITSEETNERLDIFLAGKLPDFSRVQVQRLIKDGLVTVNEKVVKASHRIVAGDQVNVVLLEADFVPDVQPEEIPLNVIYEDEHLVAINKPAGLVVHPASSHLDGTMVNALLARFPQLSEFPERERAGIVHRLDKDTSGVILVALTVDVQEKLAALFKNRDIHKTYWGLVEGRPKTESGQIDAPIARDPKKRKRMAVIHDGKPSTTEFRTLERFEKHTLLEMHPVSGRTHQLRVHMAFIGCPMVGDNVYGYRQPTIKLNRVFLHARSIAFNHPVTGEAMFIETDLPKELQKILEQLRQQQS